jgi:hypothetical protein
MSVEVIRHILSSAKNSLKLLKRERSFGLDSDED